MQMPLCSIGGLKDSEIFRRIGIRRAYLTCFFSLKLRLLLRIFNEKMQGYFMKKFKILAL